MSNAYEGDVVRDGPHGGVWVLHRYGTDGDWRGVTNEDIVAELEAVPHVHGGRTVLPDCPDCPAVTTWLREAGHPVRGPPV